MLYRSNIRAFQTHRDRISWSLSFDITHLERIVVFHRVCKACVFWHADVGQSRTGKREQSATSRWEMSMSITRVKIAAVGPLLADQILGLFLFQKNKNRAICIGLSSQLATRPARLLCWSSLQSTRRLTSERGFTLRPCFSVYSAQFVPCAVPPVWVWFGVVVARMVLGTHTQTRRRPVVAPQENNCDPGSNRHPRRHGHVTAAAEYHVELQGALTRRVSK